MSFPKPDREQLLVFVPTIFGKATPGGVVPLRAYLEGPDRRPHRPELWSWCRIGPNLGALANAAGDHAWVAAMADESVVFACPPCTFKTHDKASESNVAEGLTISVECDEHPERARDRGEDLLGPATLVVASGGRWTDPETIVGRKKLHLHWVLKVPARTFQELVKLVEARRRLAILVGGDPTGAPVSHCYRWPGSWHRKGEQPVLCRIVEARPHIAIELDSAYARIEAAERAARAKDAADCKQAAKQQRRGERVVRMIGNVKRQQPGELDAALEDVAAALDAITNPDRAEAIAQRGAQWQWWNRVVMAVWAAAGGSEVGRKLAEDWSAKSDIHTPEGFTARWEGMSASPPSKLGVGTLFYMARQAQPGWRKPSDIALDPPPVDAEGRPVIDVDVGAETEPGAARFRSTRLPVHQRKPKGQRPGPGADGVAAAADDE